METQTPLRFQVAGCLLKLAVDGACNATQRLRFTHETQRVTRPMTQHPSPCSRATRLLHISSAHGDCERRTVPGGVNLALPPFPLLLHSTRNATVNRKTS